MPGLNSCADVLHMAQAMSALRDAGFPDGTLDFSHADVASQLWALTISGELYGLAQASGEHVQEWALRLCLAMPVDNIMHVGASVQSFYF